MIKVGRRLQSSRHSVRLRQSENVSISGVARHPRMPEAGIPTLGFTLIEVLFAVVIFGISSIMLTQAYVNCLYTVSQLEVADDPVAEARFVRQQVVLISDLDELESGGQIETLSYGEAEWEVEIEPWPEEEPITDMHHVILTVTLDENEAPPGTAPFVFDFVVLRPTWTEDTDRTSTLSDAQERVRDFKETHRGF